MPVPAPILYSFGQRYPDYTFSTDYVGNTLRYTTMTDTFFKDEVIKYNFNYSTQLESGFLFKSFYETTYNPVPRYDTKFSMNTISSSFISNKSTMFYSTKSGATIVKSYKNFTSMPEGVGLGAIDVIAEVVCTDELLLYTAEAYSSPNPDETILWDDLYRPVPGGKFTLQPSSVGLFFMWGPDGQSGLNHTQKILKINESKQFSSRWAVFGGLNPVPFTENSQLFVPVTNSAIKTDFFLSYSIQVNNTLDSKKNPTLYNQRQSGYRGEFRNFLYYRPTGEYDTTLAKEISFCQINTLNSADSIRFIDKVKLDITTFQINHDWNAIRFFGDFSQNAAERISHFGNSPFFAEKNMTLSFKDDFYSAYTTMKGDNAIGSGVMNGGFSTVLGEGDFLGIANRCVFATPKGLPDDYSDYGGVWAVKHFSEYKSCNRYDLYFENNFGYIYEDYENFFLNANYMNHDNIIKYAAKEMSQDYPNPLFYSYRNKYSTYWSNNLP